VERTHHGHKSYIRPRNIPRAQQPATHPALKHSQHKERLLLHCCRHTRGMIDKCCREYCTIHMSAQVFCRQAGAFATHEKRKQEGPSTKSHTPDLNAQLHSLVCTLECPTAQTAWQHALPTAAHAAENAPQRKVTRLDPSAASSDTGKQAALSQPALYGRKIPPRAALLCNGSHTVFPPITAPHSCPDTHSCSGPTTVLTQHHQQAPNPMLAATSACDQGFLASTVYLRLATFM
jgi:hypothetical protein